jgi:hypothetical protein
MAARGASVDYISNMAAERTLRLHLGRGKAIGHGKDRLMERTSHR